MDRHFTLTEALFPGGTGAEFEKFTFATLIAVAIFYLGFRVAARLRTEEGVKENLVPDSKFGVFGFFDLFFQGFISFHDSILGKHNRRYLSVSVSIFLLLLFGNIFGLVPGMPAPTATVWITLAMAIVVFIAFNVYGVVEHGVANYLKHFAGGKDVLSSIYLAILIAPILFALEVLSTFLRIFTLNARLYWNIHADHIVINTMSDLMGSWVVLIGPILMAKGLMVSVLQAGVFTVLTMVYILLATQHEEEH